MIETRNGGCLCGAVRYRVEWPPLAMATCACTNCQKQSGSALSVVGITRRDAIEVDGELAIYMDRADNGNAVERKFCCNCGSPILTDTATARDQGIIFFKAGTLDRTDDLAPTTHYWTGSGQHWLHYPEGQVRLATQ